MRDVTIAVRLSFAVEEDITMGELAAFVRQAIEAKLDADAEMQRLCRNVPAPRIQYNGDPVERVEYRL